MADVRDPLHEVEELFIKVSHQAPTRPKNITIVLYLMKPCGEAFVAQSVSLLVLYVCM